MHISKIGKPFFLAVQYTEAGEHLLYIHHLLHKVNMCCTYFCIIINTEYTYFGMRGGTDKQQVTDLYYYSNILIETSLLSLRYWLEIIMC